MGPARQIDRALPLWIATSLRVKPRVLAMTDSV
jgi:hypothetical protein